MTLEHSKRPTILLVDDTLENLQVLISSLKEQGFRIAVAQSGEEALQRVEHVLPDLILLDVRMPGIDGFETCRRLKAHESGKDIPVIFLSALNDVFDKVKAFSSGGVDYLTKPVQHEEVLARIKTHLTIRKLQQQLREHNARLEEQNIRLEEQHERFRTLSEATFAGILIHDEGHIIEVNQMMLNMFGYQRAEVLGKHVLEFVTSESHDIIAEHFRTKAEHPYEVEGIRKDESTFPLEIQARSMPYDGRDVRVASIRDLSWRRALEEENARLLRETIPDRYKFGELIGKSPEMQRVYELIVKAASTEANVLIQGETGVGKELVARTIHQESERRAKPFIVVNCGAVTDTLFEREFFGHRKGTFTGADRDRKGLLASAHQGILVLDEIEELSLAGQVILLRAIETGEYTPVGDHSSRHADVRVIAVTNQDLDEMRRQGTLRNDFFYRIQVITITVPPLRERREDIPLLIEHVLEHDDSKARHPEISGRLLGKLSTYDWPGNVRELEHTIQSYLALGQIELPVADKNGPQVSDEPGLMSNGLGLYDALRRFEKQIILRALKNNSGSKQATAARLGIDRRTLYQKMKKYGII